MIVILEKTQAYHVSKKLHSSLISVGNELMVIFWARKVFFLLVVAVAPLFFYHRFGLRWLQLLAFEDFWYGDEPCLLGYFLDMTAGNIWSCCLRDQGPSIYDITEMWMGSGKCVG